MSEKTSEQMIDELVEVAERFGDIDAARSALLTRIKELEARPTMSEVLDAIEEANTWGRDFELIADCKRSVRKLFADRTPESSGVTQ